jgi:hypothetical protein
MLSGKGTISYRSPPSIISTKSASRRFATPNAGADRNRDNGFRGTRLGVVKAVAGHDNDDKEQSSRKITPQEVTEGRQEGGIVKEIKATGAIFSTGRYSIRKMTFLEKSKKQKCRFEKRNLVKTHDTAHKVHSLHTGRALPSRRVGVGIVMMI